MPATPALGKGRDRQILEAWWLARLACMPPWWAGYVTHAEHTPISSPSRDAQYNKKKEKKEKGEGGKEGESEGRREGERTQVAHSPMI